MRRFLSFLVIPVLAVSFAWPSASSALGPPVEFFEDLAPIRSSNSSAVYIRRGDTRHVFPNESVFLSYFNDFSNVEWVEPEVLSSYTLGDPVIMAPGQLIKIQSNNNVYLIDSDGSRRHVTSESIAEEMYGATWASRVHDVSPTRLFDYWIGPDLDETAMEQSLKDGMLYWMEDAYPMVRNDRTWGDTTRANVHMVVFGGLEDPFSARLYDSIVTLKGEYGDTLAVSWQHFPLSFHTLSWESAELAECANRDGKMWEYMAEVWTHDGDIEWQDLMDAAAVVGIDEEWFSRCNYHYAAHEGRVSDDLIRGEIAGVTGTPSSMINGQFVAGAVNTDTLRSIIDQHLFDTVVAPLTPAE